ncbi:MAG TPA: CotH kinase family protein [Polyangiaceae bacterium]|nr:CotH kinase family protein [Polyangiaceae bacterium]
MGGHLWLAVIAPLGLVACGDEAGADGAAEAAALRAEAAANEAAQAEFYGLGRRVEIEVELAPADWEALREQGRSLIGTFIDPNASYSFTYFNADVTIDGQRYEDVAVRKKGYIGSLSADRPSIKLDLGRNGRGLEHIGLDEITLNNDRQDPSHSHQCLAYGMFAAAGVPASRCGLAHVVVNGEDLGTYTNVEPIGKPLLERYFEDDGGNLYEGQIVDFVAEQADLFQLKTNEAANDRSDLTRLIEALDGDDAGLVERLGGVLDLDEFRTFWALETLLGHWDGYSGNSNNFYVYHDPTSDRFSFLPWGTDGAFQGQNPFDFLNTSIAVYARGRIANRLYALPDQRQAFRARLGELVDGVWDEQALDVELDQIAELAVDALPAAVSAQRALITSHPVALRAELEREAPDWIMLPAPGGPANPCAGAPSEIRGSFDTTWGTLAAPSAGASVEASVDGQPLQATWVGGAGMNEVLVDGIPRVQLSAQISPTRSLTLDIQLTPRTFKPGVTPFHGIEKVGFVNVSDSAGGFLPGGFVGDGAVEFDAAGMEPGAPVTGRFSGRLLQLGCITQ